MPQAPQTGGQAKKQTAGWGDKGWQRGARQPLLSPFGIDGDPKVLLQRIFLFCLARILSNKQKAMG
jgi:hypothetical protein